MYLSHSNSLKLNEKLSYITHCEVILEKSIIIWIFGTHKNLKITPEITHKEVWSSHYFYIKCSSETTSSQVPHLRDTVSASIGSLPVKFFSQFWSFLKSEDLRMRWWCLGTRLADIITDLMKPRSVVWSNNFNGRRHLIKSIKVYW